MSKVKYFIKQRGRAKYQTESPAQSMINLNAKLIQQQVLFPDLQWLKTWRTSACGATGATTWCTSVTPTLWDRPRPWEATSLLAFTRMKKLLSIRGHQSSRRYCLTETLPQRSYLMFNLYVFYFIFFALYFFRRRGTAWSGQSNG